MSLLLLWVGPRAVGFPRVSGDEPVGKDVPFTFAPFSPRERG